MSYIVDTKLMTVNVQAEKYRLIEWLINVTDRQTLEELAAVRQRNQSPQMSVISPEELVARAEESNRAIEQGDVYDIAQIIKDR